MGPHGAKRGPREAEWETETTEMFAVPFPLHHSPPCLSSTPSNLQE